VAGSKVVLDLLSIIYSMRSLQLTLSLEHPQLALLIALLDQCVGGLVLLSEFEVLLGFHVIMCCSGASLKFFEFMILDSRVKFISLLFALN